jgi:hypothetical protein
VEELSNEPIILRRVIVSSVVRVNSAGRENMTSDIVGRLLSPKRSRREEATRTGNMVKDTSYRCDAVFSVLVWGYGGEYVVRLPLVV